jgi:hypothetical protein
MKLKHNHECSVRKDLEGDSHGLLKVLLVNQLKDSVENNGKQCAVNRKLVQ